MSRVDGKVVVVTGAARGQGASAVRALVDEGAVVVATDVLDDQGEALVASLSGPGRAVYRHLDVADPEQWTGLADHARDAYGRVDALVNNAGIASRDRLPDVDLPTWHRTFDVNVTGPMLGIQALVGLMPPGGSIVNVCSVAALSGHVAAAYTASKWALRGLTRSAALEFGPRGVRANAIMPGFIDTPLMEGASPRFRDAAMNEIPLQRVGVPGDVAPLVVYLVSDESTYVTGAEIAVDGGLTGHVSHKHIADAIATPPDGAR